MANNEVNIRITANDEASEKFKDVETQFGSSSKKMKKNFIELAAKVFLFQKAITAAGRVLGTFTKNAAQVQQLNVRLQVLLGTVEEGNKLFSDMRDLASELPFEFNQVMEAATSLSGVVRGGAEEVNAMMPMIADLAAASGLGIQESTSQIIRMYSAGAGAADLFRDRGILAMLGFKAGVSVTAEETMDQVIKAWEDGDSKFRGATEKLKLTWDGKISVMRDAWFNFTAEVGETIIENPGTLALIDNLTMVLDFWTSKLADVNGTTEVQVTLMDDMLIKLDEINVELERQREGMENSMFGFGANAALEESNTLLEQKARIMLAITELQKKGGQEKKKDVKDEKQKGKVEDKNSKDKIKNDKSVFDNTMGIANAGMALAEVVAEDSKGLAIAGAVISTAQGVAKAFADYTYPVALVIGALVAAAGAAQIAKISGTKFAEGTDSVPAMLSPGEMVIPTSFADSIRRGSLTLGAGAGVEGGDIGGGNTFNIFIDGGVNPEGRGVEEVAEELGFEVERLIRTGRSI